MFVIAARLPFTGAVSEIDRANPVSATVSQLLPILLASIALIIGSTMIPSPIWAVLAAGVFVLMTLVINRVAPAALVILAPILAIRFTEFISGVAIESGAYMTETFQSGAPTGAFSRLLLVHGFFFAVATTIIQAAWPRLSGQFLLPDQWWNRRVQPVALLLAAILALAALYVAYLGMTSGLPLLTGEDRFSFQRRLDSNVLQFVLGNRSVFAVMIGAIFLDRRLKFVGYACCATLLSISLLLGEKFTSLVELSLLFAIPAGLSHIARGGVIPLGSIVKVGVGLTILTIPAILLAYGGMNDLPGAVARLGERVSQQGQLWFLTDRNHFQLVAWNSSKLGQDFQTWFDVQSQDSRVFRQAFGRYWIMAEYVPAAQLGFIMDTGGGYVFSQMPYALRTMGFVGLMALTAIIAAYHAGLFLLIAYALPRMNLFALIALGRVLIGLTAFYYTGYFFSVFGIKTLLAIAAALFFLWLGRYRIAWR